MTLDYVLGLDVSKWQGEMDWEVAAAAGAKFAIIRAGYGTSDGYRLEDNQFIRNSALAPLSIPEKAVGYYYYFHPAAGMLQQAEHFCDLIQGVPWRICPIIDIEVDGGLTASQLGTQIEQVVRYIMDRLGVVPVVIYTRMSFWNPEVDRRDLWGVMDLFAARYSNTLTSPWSDGNYEPLDWELTDWDMWQWSADGNGRGAEFGAQSGSIDLDYYNGTYEQFLQYLIPEEEEEPQPLMVKIVSLRKSATFEAGTASRVAIDVPVDTVWNITAIHGWVDRAAKWVRLELVAADGNVTVIAKQLSQAVADHLLWEGSQVVVAGEKLQLFVQTWPDMAATKVTLSIRGIVQQEPTPVPEVVTTTTTTTTGTDTETVVTVS